MYTSNFIDAVKIFDDVFDMISQNPGMFIEVCKKANEEEGDNKTTKTAECGCGGKCKKSECECKKYFGNDITKDIKHVLFNDPVTVVTFADGSVVRVRATANDTFNKEVGLLQAIVKRLYANDIEDKGGYLKASGLGEKINKIVANATDQKELAKNKKTKAGKKAASEEKKATKKTSDKKTSGKKKTSVKKESSDKKESSVKKDA